MSHQLISWSVLGFATGVGLGLIWISRVWRGLHRRTFDEAYALGREHGFEMRRFHAKDLEALSRRVIADAARKGGLQ